MTEVSGYQQSRNGPLTRDAVAYLDKQRLDNNWSFKQLGEQLGISAAFAHSILNKGTNITTNSYMPRIEAGIERMKGGGRAATESLPQPASVTVATREHSFHLREGVVVTFSLPADLTDREVERLALFIRSLSE